MANEKLKLNAGRQYALTLVQEFTYEHVGEDGVAVPVAKLPPEAILLSGSLAVTTAMGTTEKIALGTATAATRYGDLVVSAGVKALTVDGKPHGEGLLWAKPNDDLVAGAATLIVTYVMPARANEVQPG